MYIRNALPKVMNSLPNTELNISDMKEALPSVMPPFPEILSTGQVGGSKYFNLVKYYGGKWRQLKYTLPYIEMVAKANDAHTYVECFGGGGKCILNLDTLEHKFKKAIYNEMDPYVCSIFQVVSDPDMAQQMFEIVDQLDFNRETFNYCRQHKKDTDNSLLGKASMTFAQVQMGFNGLLGSFAGDKTAELFKDRYKNACKKILEAPEHLRNVEVINGDYRKLMKKYGSDPQVVKYLDPPYHPSTRNRQALDAYPNELSMNDHKELVEILCNSRSWVMSGYDPAQYGCDDYKPLEDSGAVKESIGMFLLYSSNKNGGNVRREEFIWYKF